MRERRHLYKTLRFASFLFSFFLSISALGATYYVSPNGNDNTGNGSEGNPWRTISKAVQQASAGDVIKVMDDDNDSTDDYVENVVVDKRLTIEAYDNDGTLPTVKSSTGGTEPVFKLTADGTIIRRLRMYGTSTDGGSAVWINGANYCEVDGIQTGWASGKQCYFGVYIGLGDAGKNKYNLIHNSQLNRCYGYGVYLNGASMNSIIGNEITYNKYGVFLYNNATANMICGNTVSYNSEAGLYLRDSIADSVFILNTVTWNKYGIYDYYSTGGRDVYLNEIQQNTTDNVYNYNCYFYSPTKLSYLFKHVITFKNLMGNYYGYGGSAPTGSDDPDMEGVAKDFYYENNSYARYPLIVTPDQYYLYVWYLANPVMYRGEVRKDFKTITLSGGNGSRIWTADEAAIDSVYFPAGSSSDGTTWTGLLTFSTAPANGDAFDIFVGYADDQNGTNFTQGGPTATVIGDGSKIRFDFTCTASAFTLPQGKYLAVKIVNKSSNDYDLMVGGAWSFISSPEGSQRYPRTTPSGLDVMYVSYNGSDATGMGTVASPLRSFRSVLSVISAGKTIKVIDDNQSGSTDFRENMTIDKALTIEPYQNDSTPPEISGYTSNKHGFEVTANNVTIRNLKITGCLYGIYAKNASNCTFTGNSSIYNDGGIGLESCNSITVSENICSSNDSYGIKLVKTTNSTISDNQCKNNDSAGIMLDDYSTGNTVSGNDCSSNGIGIKIYLHSDQNRITGNTCNSNSQYGIYCRADKNLLYNNTANQNTYYGIYIFRGDWNVAAHNTLSGNEERGIDIYGYTFDYCYYNCLAYNNVGSSKYGIYFSGNASSNEAFANTIHDNTTAGIHSDLGNTAYFNDLSNNAKTIEDGSLTPVSSRKMGYIYGSLQVTRKEYLGNYYSDYTGNDANGDGIGDTPYADGLFKDSYPLKQSISNYNLQTWFIQTGSYIKRDVTDGYGTLTVNGNSSVVLVDPQAALQKIDFGAGNQSQTTSWTGRIWLTSNNEYNFTIQMGYADADGGNFTPSNCTDNPSGIASEYYFYFATTASEFDVPKGKHLAVRITNNLSGSKEIVTGGTYSYISAPVQSQDYSLPVTFSTITAELKDGKVILKWITASEVGNVGFNVWRGKKEEGPFQKRNLDLIRSKGDSSMPQKYSFTDEDVENGRRYFYYIESVDLAGVRQRSGLVGITVTAPPKETALLQNYPNPFNPETWIPFQLSKDSSVVIRIYDLRGRLVRKLDLGLKKAGYYVDKSRAAYWDGRNEQGERVASGVYIYQMTAGKERFTKRLVILK